MAVSSPLNRRYAEMPGYTGGLANRSTKAVGRDGNTSAPMPGGVQPPMMSRQDNILQSRMDGSFDAKRDAFNRTAKGQTMDEAGNIMPSTGTQPAVTPPAQFASAPDGMGGNKMVRLPTPASQPGQSGPPSGGTHTLSAPATAPAPGVRPPQVMGPNMGPPRPRRNLAAEETARATPVTPPVTRNVTNNAPSPVTPPTPSRPGGMMGAAAQVAQGMQTAMTTTMSPAPVAPSQVMPRAKAFLAAMQQQRMTPTTTTPPAPIASSPPIPRTPSFMPRMKTVPGDESTPRRKAVIPPAAVTRIPAREKGGPVTAGKPYLVGEKGPEIIVPKQSGTVIPNHALKTPAMDKLASQGKMDTLPRDRRTISTASSDSRASRLPADSDAAKKWLTNWGNKEADKAEAGRDSNLVAEEKRLGLPSIKHLHKGKPSSQWDEAKVGFDEGLTRVGQMTAGLGDMVGIPGSDTRRNLYKERADVMNAYRKRGSRAEGGISVGDMLASSISEAPGFYNPLSKPGQITKVGNAIWHGIRGYAPEKSIVDGAISSASNLIGEKAEDIVTRGKGLAGNIVGTVAEKAANYFRDETSYAGLGVQPPAKFKPTAVMANN